MKPIAQTFYINEPDNGVAGVYLTSIDLFFKSKSPTFGIQVQIRATDNGNPTTSIMPFADLKLPSSAVNVSDDASVATNFVFTSPVFLQSATSYAIVILPLGGNPDYQIWTAELGGTDVTTNSPIKTNNDTGTLFLSSNDIQFTSIQTEDIKFVIYTAEFKTNAGKAVFTSKDSDYLLVKDKIGKYFPREILVVSNNSYDLTRLIITSNTGAFTPGETIYQSNGSSNVATGVLYSANNSTLKITNTVGAFVTTYQVKGSASNSNSVISAAYANVITTLDANTLTVPFTNVFSVNQMIYFGTSSRNIMQPSYITEIVDGTTLQLSTIASFTETAAMLGRVRGDGNLHAQAENLSDVDTNPNRINITLDNVTSNNTLNFSNSSGQYLIGTRSGASANIINSIDSSYNAIIPQFAESKPGDTNITWSFVGVTNDANKTPDTTNIPLVNHVEKELFDKSRSLMSRSNEYTKLTGSRKGSATTLITANVYSTNNMISPVIDVAAKSMVTTISNAIVSKDRLFGYRLLIENNPFVPGDVVKQQNSSSVFVEGGGPYVFGEATVDFADDTQIIVSNVNGYFNSANDILLSSDSNVNAYVTDASMYNERLNNNLKFASRYISKSVILAEGQDAEDINVFLTAYRPAATDILVYGRFQNGEDPDPFQYKNWTLLNQITPASLLSSSANINDFVEIQYGLPKSQQLARDSSNCNVSSETMRINSFATQRLNVGDFVYVADTTSDKFFVSKVRKIVNTNLIMLNSFPPFSIPNGSFGVIPNLETTAGAFVYSANNNVMRYVSANNSVVFDTYKTFAIKIVPVSDSTAVVPRVRDLRAIALQV